MTGRVEAQSQIGWIEVGGDGRTSVEVRMSRNGWAIGGGGAWFGLIWDVTGGPWVCGG